VRLRVRARPEPGTVGVAWTFRRSRASSSNADGLNRGSTDGREHRRGRAEAVAVAVAAARARARAEELAGNLAHVNPHTHVIVTAGAFSLDGTRFHRLPERFTEPLEELVRFRVLSRMRTRGVLGEERGRMLAGWRHSGLSVFVGRPIAPGDKERLERLARYVRRFHLAESRLIYDEAAAA